jgi:hypothetical protein
MLVNEITGVRPAMRVFTANDQSGVPSALRSVLERHGIDAAGDISDSQQYEISIIPTTV